MAVMRADQLGVEQAEMKVAKRAANSVDSTVYSKKKM